MATFELFLKFEKIFISQILMNLEVKKLTRDTKQVLSLIIITNKRT